MSKPNRPKEVIPPILRVVLESQRKVTPPPLHVSGSFAWLSDIEIPFHNAKFINEVFTVAKLYGIRQCVWGGDAVHLEAFSPFPGADTDAESEIAEIDEYLPGFLEPFEKIFWIMGNHDDRAQRMLTRKISNEKALRMLVAPETVELFRRKVTVSENYWMTADDNWQLEHAKNNSMVPGGVARALSLRFHKNIIHGHTHKSALMRVNGYYAIESGCGVDIDRLQYPNLRHSTHPDMQNGAVLMLWHNGKYNPLLVTPENIQFNLWLARRCSR